MSILQRVNHWRRSLRAVDHHVPLGKALRDHLDSGVGRTVDVSRSDGLLYSIETEEFFSLKGRLHNLDETALTAARGRILDVGAGAGRHALALQQLGCEVVAVDISPLCVEVMRARGVNQAHVADVFSIGGGKNLGEFDTVLFLMQSIGIAGSLFGLEQLLDLLRPLVRPGGQLLLDSSPLLRVPGGSSDLSEGIDVSFAYEGYRGESFSWLYLDERMLGEVAIRRGWNLEILGRTSASEYLARLRPVVG
ncbi:MAG TPA: class I SAM-dependent methyltransferase [Myxococcales bacterium]|nr:class I SAM-dependent methyltransferase [Myxococcales bacterium]